MRFAAILPWPGKRGTPPLERADAPKWETKIVKVSRGSIAPFLVAVVMASMLFSVFPARAGMLTLESSRGNYPLAPYVEVLEDPTRELTINEILKGEHPGRFVPSLANTLNFGVSSSAFWLRFSILDERTERGVLTSWVVDLTWENLESVRLFTPDPEAPGGYRQLETGSRYQQPASPMRGLRPVLPLDGPRGEPGTYYVRIEHEGAIMLPAHVRSVENYLSRNWLRAGISGFYVGTLFSIALYNLLIFLALRQRVYLFYVGYLLFGIVYYLSKVNLLEETLFFGLPTLDARVRFSALSLAVLCCVAFSRDFLNTRVESRKLDGILFAFGVVWAVFTCLIPVIPVPILDSTTSVLGILSPVLFLGAGLIRFIRGFAPARYFVLAWAFLTLGYTLWSLMHLGVIGASEIVPWTVIGISAFEAILLSFALSDRIRTLREEKEEARSRERRYRTLAITDELTGLNNVRFFRTQLPLETQRAEKLQLPLTLGLLDIDQFKPFNDTHGHPAGDEALRQLGEVIFQCVRERDIACRYGGEEFVILFPATRAAEAFEAAERIRLSYEQVRRAAGHPHYGATVSFGLAEFAHGERPEELVDRADRALYKAKHIGRNRTVIAPHK